MYYYVNGTVAEIGPNLAVIDCGGVGYACATTNYTLAQLKRGEQAKLYTYLHVREEIFDLYGFSTQAELSSFKMLLGVSGVGPKAALAKEQTGFDARMGTLSPIPAGGKTQEAASALAVLGYSSQEISAALKGVDAALPVEEMIRIALKKMAR